MDYPDLEYEMYICAKQFGWTVTEFYEQPVQETQWLIAISQLEAEVENEQQSTRS